MPSTRRRSLDLAAKERAVFLSPEAPYPPIGGGAIRTASLLEYLRQDRVVDLLLFHDPASPPPDRDLPRDWKGDVHVFRLPLHERGGAQRAVRNMARLLRRVPPLLDRFAGFERELADWLKGRQYGVGVVEHFWCAPYVAALRPHVRTAILDLHNIESEFHERCAEAESGPSALAHRAFSAYYRELERQWLPCFDRLLATSSDDAGKLIARGVSVPVTVYPNAVPYHGVPIVEKQQAVIFSGNLRFLPNQTAVRWFRAEIWPALRAKFPGLRWRLLGKNPDGVEKDLEGDDRIEVIGPVADAVEHLARAQVAVVPILAGSGTRLKILEAWAAGLPVVSTTLGAEGLGATPGAEILLADSADSFVNSISALLESEELRRRLGGAGRQRYEEAFTWQAAWKQASAAGL